ncbi:MAG: hypothetical protein DWQ47_09985 [Acidobacteria bacterium]|nr:MAG: hypothetical protein DWQ32_12400 [Acidobacteriota bacterium]REJ98681.1 MAG: hypothetical protein DWQ38_15080 [Acidobacteriota bacterium]REK16663.1 MAG: hypothetical protein DWQ43_00245 [Acidobacteriota bacterium]REK42574.1 MAG: hypothetical protein DWQ47_09985 [Acidobacteriota bacterium]
MDKESKESIAARLTHAFYANAERRPGYLGPERRSAEDLAEGQRDYRQGTVTPGEVYETYKRFLSMLNGQ